ncbi:hypothetical protein C8F04DRAFT_1183819 [Mycena alexandri]|uniref:Uncharacterized protein n=1 Tax=Mycena alexandri TaxID=1745969 RepID=A0AAD6X020_9AGAR|nr:hypothetical protein C8F04DRAFT_1183819 [Mycena alexandri]
MGRRRGGVGGRSRAVSGWRLPALPQIGGCFAKTQGGSCGGADRGDGERAGRRLSAAGMSGTSGDCCRARPDVGGRRRRAWERGRRVRWLDWEGDGVGRGRGRVLSQAALGGRFREFDDEDDEEGRESQSSSDSDSRAGDLGTSNKPSLTFNAYLAPDARSTKYRLRRAPCQRNSWPASVTVANALLPTGASATCQGQYRDLAAEISSPPAILSTRLPPTIKPLCVTLQMIYREKPIDSIFAPCLLHKHERFAACLNDANHRTIHAELRYGHLLQHTNISEARRLRTYQFHSRLLRDAQYYRSCELLENAESPDCLGAPTNDNPAIGNLRLFPGK